MPAVKAADKLLRLQILLKPEQVKALREHNRRTDAPMASTIRRALSSWLESQAKGRHAA